MIKSTIHRYIAIVSISLCTAQFASASTINYNFDSGLGAGLSSVNDGGGFAVDAGSGVLRVHKESETGSPTGLLRGGVATDYTIDGDFSISTTFDLSAGFVFPGEDQLNMIQLEVIDNLSGDFYSILRFRLTDGGVAMDLLDAFGVPPGTPLGLVGSTALTGSFRLSRNANILTSEFKTSAGSFTLIDQRNPSTLNGAVSVRLSAIQSSNAGPRSTTALDVSFNNLSITADQFIGIPVPASILLLLSGLVLLKRYTL